MEAFRMPVDVGLPAPDFTLMNQDRQPVSLRDLRGRTLVLVFFPAAFSGTCTKELCTFRDSLARFNDADAQELGFPLLCDFNKEVIREYGVFNEDMIGLKGIAKRAVFVVDAAGIVRYREVLDDARNEPDYEKALDAARAAALA
jgi:peroxiredoxin